MTKEVDAIIRERVRILYSKAISSSLAGIFTAVIFAYIFGQQFPSIVLIPWLVLISLALLLRFWMVLDYEKNRETIVQFDVLERRFALITGVIGLCWAAFILSGLLVPNHEYNLYSVILLVAIVSISVPVFSSSLKTVYFFIIPPLLVSIPVLLVAGGNDTAIGLGIIVFAVLIRLSAINSYNTLNDTLTLRFQTQEMAEDLEKIRHEHAIAEQRMQGIMDFAPAAIYVKDLEGHFTFLNQKVADLHKMSRQEMIGKSLYEILPEEIADKIHENDLEVIRSGKTLKYDESAPQDDGLHHYISMKFPLYDEANNIISVGGVSTDITERVRIEESLRLSQQRLLLHREQSPVGVIEWSTDFVFLDWNPAAERIFGFTKEEVIGHHITECILPESARPAVDKIWADLLNQTGGSYSLNENTTKDGRTILCEWHNTPLVDQDSKVIGVASLVDDVTERIRTEESLRISQQRLLLHREQSPVGVIEWNTGFEFLDWNPAAERIFGFTKEEVAGHHITERILPESARPAVDKVWAGLLAQTGGTYSLNENITKDGRTILCEWHNTPLVDHNGEVIGVTSLVDDVTEREKNEENLRRTQKMDAIGKLTGGIAHDFNNMLGVILGYAHLMKKRVNDDQPKLVKYSNEIINACGRAKSLTTKLMEFSRKAPSSDEVTFINPLLLDMRHMLETTLTPRIKLVLELQDNLWPVWLDKSRLEDSVLNMCINSMHAMPDGGALTLRTDNIQLKEVDLKGLSISTGGYVRLSISDTGAGMSAGVQQKMFDPFFTTKAESGTGLGMSQVYGFVQQINGDIKVYSEVGQGTRIVLYIPRSEETEVILAEQKSDNAEQALGGHESILVVDDEVALLELAEEILTDKGYSVLRAENTDQALEVLKNKTVDLMLSDVIMPGKDGYQLAMEVEAQYPAVKIQMVTGFTDERQNKLGDSKLHEERLLKPYTSEQLLSKLRLLLDKR